MEPFHPFNDPQHYGREYDHIERPQPGIHPGDSMWAPDPQRDYQERLTVERMRREQEAHYYAGQEYIHGLTPPGVSEGRPIKRLPEPHGLLGGYDALIDKARLLGMHAVRLLMQSDAPSEVIIPERTEVRRVQLPFNRGATIPPPPAPGRKRLLSRRMNRLHQYRKETSAIRFVNKAVVVQPEVSGWLVGSRWFDDPLSLSSDQASVSERGDTFANLYLLPERGLCLGPAKPAKVEKIKDYTRNYSTGLLRMDVVQSYDTHSKGGAVDREARSLNQLKSELAHLLIKHRILKPDV